MPGYGTGDRRRILAAVHRDDLDVVLLRPTEEFRLQQTRVLPRAVRLGSPVSDPERAQQQRLARDRLVAEDAVRTAP